MSNFTEKQHKALELKAKRGWACYYNMKDSRDAMTEWVMLLQERNKDLYDKVKSGDDIDISYLKCQYLEMYEELKRETDCPVCLETITKENCILTNCGHLYCLNCYDKLDKCAICRKKFYKKN